MEEEISIQKAYEIGRRIGRSDDHCKPSRETIEMIAELKTKTLLTEQKMDDLIEKVDGGFKQLNERMDKDNAEHKEMMTEVRQMVEEKANKWVEKMAIWIGITFGLGFLTLLGWLILNAIKIFPIR